MSANDLLQRRTLDELEIEDEPAFKHIGLYAELKQVLIDAKYTFRTLPDAFTSRWDRALFLNLTFWTPEAGGDILSEDAIPADVVAHVAWHHLANRALADHPKAPTSAKPSMASLLLGESIASAFDLYLVGRTLGRPNASSFLESQVPRMTDVALGAGLSEADFEELLAGVAAEPERAFEDLRELLYDTTFALALANDASSALEILGKSTRHRFGALLHHYEISNWVLYTRAYADASPEAGKLADEIDAALRSAPVALDWLEKNWVERGPDPELSLIRGRTGR